MRVLSRRVVSASPGGQATGGRVGDRRLGLLPDPAPLRHLRPCRVRYGAGCDPLASLPPGGPVLVEECGDGVLDARREVTHGLVCARDQRLTEADGELTTPRRGPALAARH